MHLTDRPGSNFLDCQVVRLLHCSCNGDERGTMLFSSSVACQQQIVVVCVMRTLIPDSLPDLDLVWVFVNIGGRKGKFVAQEVV